MRFLLVLLTVASLTACNQAPKQAVADTGPSAKAADTPAAKAADTAANSEAAALADFKAKVEKYAEMRDKLDDHTTPLKKTNDPEAITRAEQSLAVKIREARPDAKQGEFFTPATVAAFRKLMKPALKGAEGTENRNAIKDDVPENVPFQIDGDYPKEQTVSTVPPDVLLNLPALPKDVQYRFVGRHLILLDARANTIIDYFLNATS